jgi:hypothetical protein
MVGKRRLFGILPGRRAGSDIAVGHKFKKRDAPWVIWEVSLLKTGPDGTAYAQLMGVGDHTLRKTVSRATLESGIEYVRARDL